jgi:beta-alanine degradation protein BauB
VSAPRSVTKLATRAVRDLDACGGLAGQLHRRAESHAEQYPVRQTQAMGSPEESDPTVTDPDKYRVVLENDHVRVLEYVDRPGDRTSPHEHPDSVMYTLSSFRRRLYRGGEQIDVELAAGLTTWLPAQRHAGENTGETETHALFVELKPGGRRPESAPDAPGSLGPTLT